jgi:hypothetical protein
VLQSRWSKWFGIPVSLPAIALYLAVLFFLARLGPKKPVEAQRQAWKFLFGCAIAILGSALWFVGLQFLVIKNFCPWCMTMHATGSFLALLILLNAPLQPAPEKQWQLEKAVFLPPHLAKTAAILALGALAFLAAGQSLYQSKTYRVQNLSGEMSATKSNVPAGLSNASPPLLSTSRTPEVSTSTQEAPIAKTNPPVTAPPLERPNPLAGIPRPTVGPNGKAFSIYAGRFVFDLAEVPMIGAPSAPKTMVSLFDYSCHHCRVMHPIIMQAHQAFGDQLGIISLPMPLDAQCNFTVRRTPRPHINSCDYAKLGLAVWHANRAAHPQFDEFMFASETPPPIESARQFAAQLAGGADALGKALSDGWVNQYLKLGIDIYATNSIYIHNGSMPQLIVGTNLTSGTLNSPADLYKIVQEQLGIQPRL